MKGHKEILNGAVNNSKLRKLTDLELEAIKRCTLDIYKKVVCVCNANDLTIMLGGGSALGAVRHKGFIPWDDDMDLNMPRKDYNKFITLCESGVLGDNYDFSFPNKKHDSPCAFLKIYRKDTKIIGLAGEDNRFPLGLDIDIFPIEGAPSNLLLRVTKGYLANLLRLIMNLVGESGKWSDSLSALCRQNWKLLWYMRCRQFVGRLFSIISHKRWVCWFDSFVACESISSFVVIPTGRKLYHGETFPASVFFPVSKGVFEGLEVNLPATPDIYLKRLYGDYMIIPPVEKRESHMIVDLQLPKEFYGQ